MIDHGREPLTIEEIQALSLYSNIHYDIAEILEKHGPKMDQNLVFDLEDALIKALKPSENRRDFVEFSILSVGAPRLIKAIEKEWPGSRVILDPFPNPEGFGVSITLIIHENAKDFPDLSEKLLDEDGKVKSDFV